MSSREHAREPARTLAREVSCGRGVLVLARDACAVRCLSYLESPQERVLGASIARVRVHMR